MTRPCCFLLTLIFLCLLRENYVFEVMKYVDCCCRGGKRVRLCCFYSYLNHAEHRFTVVGV